MKRQDFIDALYSAGWRANNDAQWSGAERLHAKIFPSVAAMEDEIIDAAQDAFQAGQIDCGVDPSFSSAKNYAAKIFGRDQ